jgi:hypothetical protein
VPTFAAQFLEYFDPAVHTPAARNPDHRLGFAAGNRRGLHRRLENVNRVPAELFPSELNAYRTGGADGLVLAWDLWQIPLERLEQIAQFW